MKRIFLWLFLCILMLASCDPSSKLNTIENSVQETETFQSFMPEWDNLESVCEEPEFFEFPHYPEDFLTMYSLDGPVDLEDSEPSVINAWGMDANGDYRIAYYGDYRTYETATHTDDGTRWGKIQVVYINNTYMTSKGIAVGSEKSEVIEAYQKYGIEEYNISQITQFNLWSLDIVIKGINLSETFLYIDIKMVFDNAYTGIDYWGGLGAYIFILDSHDFVTGIVAFAPTSG